ncbi:hypothetical protein M426DRAFT_170010 [Hypoxylon sp. CI-4A]|nr:hypothetical protein M426DRAFT_170010 [Hypoxylon sp. CI-4A]
MATKAGVQQIPVMWWPSSEAWENWYRAYAETHYPIPNPLQPGEQIGFGRLIWPATDQISRPIHTLTNPMEILYLVEWRLAFMEVRHGAPESWLREVIKCFRAQRLERMMDMKQTSWASFNFTIPTYDPGWVLAPVKGQRFSISTKARYHATNNWLQPNFVNEIFAPKKPPKQPGPASNSNNTGGKSRAYFNTTLVPIDITAPIIYYYPSTVAFHRSLDDAWVVEPDGAGGFDVYDITDILKRLGVTEADFTQTVSCGAKGPMLVSESERAQVIRDMFREGSKDARPIGKLVDLIRKEEVAENNGQNGKPSWITIGHRIFDVTEFPFQGPEEQIPLENCIGGPISTTLHPRLINGDLFSRLSTYMCGHLDLSSEMLPTSEPYTWPTLRWHDNPNMGVHIAINHQVYDITGEYSS